jgi:hypothetical protein
MAAERMDMGEIMMGGSFMRQNNFIFDVDNNMIGVARASCNSDPF